MTNLSKRISFVRVRIANLYEITNLWFLKAKQPKHLNTRTLKHQDKNVNCSK